MKPSEEYTIHILEDEDFDRLPVGQPTKALGMTDPERKVAWVRRTHVRELDMGTINHEFDELMASESLHEVDGIRYKPIAALFSAIFKPLISILAKVGAGAANLGAIGPPTLGQSALAGAGILGTGAAKIGATALASKGVTNTLSTGNPFKGPSLNVNVSGGGASGLPAPGITSPFASQGGTPAPAGPLSDIDFQKSLGNVDLNLTNRLSSLSTLFRGQSESENTKFASQAGSARESSAVSRQNLIDQQSEAKRIAGII